jgi:hypothetical protein
MNRWTSGLRSLIVATLYASEIACAMVGSLIPERGDVAVNVQPARLLAQLDQVEPFAEQLEEPLPDPLRRRTLEQLPAAAGEGESDLRIAERHLGHEPGDLRGLGGVGLEELAARRQVVEKIADFDRSALGRADFLLGGNRPAVDADFRAGRAPPRARAQHEVRHRCNARQRLAPEPEGPDRVEIFGAGDLARRVPLERHPRIRRIHPLPVVLHAEQLLPAELDRHDKARCAGVQRVLDQLLDDGGRTLDDLAGGDLVGEMRGEEVDAGHDLLQHRDIEDNKEGSV